MHAQRERTVKLMLLALFIAFAPADAPRIAIAVAIEGGGYGASTAAPIARKVADAWLVGRKIEPAAAALPTAVTETPRPDFSNVVGSADAQRDAAGASRP